MFCVLFLFQTNIFAQKKKVNNTVESLQFTIYGTLGTYGAPPRLKNGRVDIPRLLSELADIHANTYHWLIWQNDNDWNDLKAFLPLAQKANLNVWVTLVPPSESKPIAKHSSEPYGLDYKRWAVELAKLSISEPSLVAWSIDDFVHNLKFYTPEYTKKMLEAARKINPQLVFIPCCYYKQTTPDFAKEYGPLFDGVLFPYRAESVGANLQDAAQVENEIIHMRELFEKPDFPIFIDIYATAHSRLGNSTPEYVKEVLKAGRKTADGVLIYCHQDPQKYPEKYQIVKEGFK
ncbi:hypothetical protein D1164_07655 [Mariniphaga sediminis]|uniref:DUF4434 domain-containing protein n=1 Tax=Mariniphaga sediminis TaxID=1628158 RepID=A0A399D1K9_9BACT|nr:hypothetical protein D1164_07655 [Mariniphaga sediminis]